MIADVFGIDKAIRAEADELLRGRGMQILLEEYGQVQLTGSYVLKLMAWRDLDICLVTDQALPVPIFFELGGRIAESLGPHRMQFRNERIASSVLPRLR